MHYCRFSEREALFTVPYVRGAQYIHAALLSQGAVCIRQSDTNKAMDSIMETQEKLAAIYKEKNEH